MVKSGGKVLVAMSGGVDSSVAAYLMVQKGYQVTGITMKIWGGGRQAISNNPHHGCYGPEEEGDIEDARRVAQQLGIPLEVIDLTREYKREVLDYFCQEYLNGRTPNPCVKCNSTVKFGALIDEAARLGLDFDFVASGHYAKIDVDPVSRRIQLKKARDLSRDQSYFLSFLSQDQLKHLLFPLGVYTKTRVREIAALQSFQVAEKPDSQNFISGSYTSILNLKAEPGPIVDKHGRVLGRHRGIHNYTIGQRKGLDISGAEPSYVTAINPETNTITVGPRDDIFRTDFEVAKVNWISIPPLKTAIKARIKIRSSHAEAEGSVTPVSDESVKVSFDQPQLAITPGQTAVFYLQDLVLGGGAIEKINP